MRKRLSAAVFLLALAACVPQPCSDPAAAGAAQTAVVSAFYGQYAVLRLNVGLPSQAHLAAIRPYLTPRLAQLIEKARAGEAAMRRRTPKGDKPDIIEGDIFTSLYEGAARVTPAAGYSAGSAWIVEIECEQFDPGAPQRQPVVWRDKVWLIGQNGSWRIDNVAYAQGGSLVQVLTQYVKAAKESK